MNDAVRGDDIGLDDVRPGNQQMMCSRSFGEPVTGGHKGVAVRLREGVSGLADVVRVLDAEGRLDRARLRRLIFADPAARSLADDWQPWLATEVPPKLEEQASGGKVFTPRFVNEARLASIEDVVEPFLLQLGLIARTARGRCLNALGWKHLGLNPPEGSQDGLFD